MEHATTRMALLVLLVLQAAELSILTAKAQQQGTPRVYILKVPEGLGKQGEHLPKCSYDNPEVWDTATNVVSDSGQDGYKIVHHYDIQHAGPWYFAKALASSKYVTNDPAAADIIYVDWQCYYLRFWSLLYKEKQKMKAAEFMRAALKTIKSTDLWGAKWGTNFVFYLQCPSLTWLLDDCAFNAFIINHERATLCKFDGSGALTTSRSVIAPYSTTTGVTSPVPNYQDRHRLLFFLGSCANPPTGGNPIGKRMRRAVVSSIQAKQAELNMLNSTVFVQCSCQTCPTRMAHDQQMYELSHTKFCMVLPGDTQSSRRITEVILSGCIPVVLLPPMHTLPLSSFVDYNRIAVFFRLAGEHPWMKQGGFESVHWVSDTPLRRVIDISSAGDILPYLRNLAESPEALAMYEQLLHAQSYFKFTGIFHALSAEQGPEDAIMHAIVTSHASSS